MCAVTHSYVCHDSFVCVHTGIAGGNGIPGLKGFYGGPFGNGRNIAKAMKKVSRRTNTQSLLKSRSQKLDTIWL